MKKQNWFVRFMKYIWDVIVILMFMDLVKSKSKKIKK